MKNSTRQRTAASTVQFFMKQTRLTKADGLRVAIVDLTANLMHLADARNLDWQDMERSAQEHFDAETGGRNVNCAKCGTPKPKRDMLASEGEGDETGKRFFYCSQPCLDKH